MRILLAFLASLIPGHGATRQAIRKAKEGKISGWHMPAALAVAFLWPPSLFWTLSTGFFWLVASALFLESQGVPRQSIAYGQLAVLLVWAHFRMNTHIKLAIELAESPRFAGFLRGFDR